MPRSLMMRSIRVTREPSSEWMKLSGATKPAEPAFGSMVVEDDDLEVGALAAAEPARRGGWRCIVSTRIRRVDRVEVDRRRVDGADLVGQQGPELAHVAVHGPAEADLAPRG